MSFTDYVTRAAIVGLGLVYPGYQSFKAVKRSDVPLQQAWLKYWLVLSVVSALSLIVEPLLYSRVPMWNFLKVAFVAFLSLPMTKGYERIYHVVLEPQLDKHEAAIDDTATKLYQAGESHARSVRPTVNKWVQQGRDTVSKTLNKKTT